MTVEHITLCRIRLAQRILIAIGENDPQLYCHDALQKALVHTTKLRMQAELKAGTAAERKTLNNRIERFEKMERKIGGKSHEETLHEIELPTAVNQ